MAENKKIGPSFYCEQCDVKLSGYAPYTMHIAGKKHLKKLKASGVAVPQKGPQGVPDSTVEDSSTTQKKPATKPAPAAGYGGKFVSGSNSNQVSSSNTPTSNAPTSKTPTSNGSTTQRTGYNTQHNQPNRAPLGRAPQYGQTNNAQRGNYGNYTQDYYGYQTHNQGYGGDYSAGQYVYGAGAQYGAGSGSYPQYSTSAGSYVTYPNVSYTDTATGQQWINPAPPVQENSDPVMKAVRDNLLGKLPKKRKLQISESCAYCKVEYSSLHHKQQHEAGKKHLKKAEKYKGMSRPGLVWERVKTSVNKRKLQISESCAYCKVEYSSLHHKQQHEAGKKHLKKAEKYKETSKPGLVWERVKASVKKKKLQILESCAYCKVEYSSLHHKQQHEAGKKHLKKAEKYKDHGPDATFYCELCKKDLNSPEQFKQHNLGVSHQKKVNAANKDKPAASLGPPPGKKRLIDTKSGEVTEAAA